MADRQPHHQTPPMDSGVAATELPPEWERELTDRFRQVLSTRRMNDLSRRTSSNRSRTPSMRSMRSTSSNTDIPRVRTPSRPRSRPITPGLDGSPLPHRHGSGHRLARLPPSSLDDFALGAPPPSSVTNIPLIPAPAVQPQHLQFRNQLFMLSETPCKWENPGLLDEAMKSIPLEKIYSDAEEERVAREKQAKAIGKKPAWAWQDCVIRALLKWFKRDFFTWINNPPCSRCNSPTVARGSAAPTAEERALSGSRVELYQCSRPDCQYYERFPRYNDAFVLLQTKRGRCGEWANCFTMLCRAMGSRVRWVWNSEDHVWTEVYSEYRKRWVHVDVCEGAFDKPLLYTEGWRKKLAYCIAFGADGAMDVTRRYCRDPAKYGLERNKVPESVLLHIMDEIRLLRRRDKEKAEKFRLEGEDMEEDRELRHYYVSNLTAEVAKLVPTANAPDPDAQKALEGRQSGSAEWRRARGEDGNWQDQHPPR